MEKNNILPMGQLDGCINTVSGRKVNLLDPQADDISIYDIARGLANNSHFGGQVPMFFSIAQHCLLVCELLEKNFGTSPKLLMYGLLHDASEAYLGDMVKPLKVNLPKFVEIENKMMAVILKKYQLNEDMKSIVKEADIMAQEIEFNAFYKGDYIEYLSPGKAYDQFIAYFFRYMNDRSKSE